MAQDIWKYFSTNYSYHYYSGDKKKEDSTFDTPNIQDFQNISDDKLESFVEESVKIVKKWTQEDIQELLLKKEAFFPLLKIWIHNKNLMARTRYIRTSFNVNKI